MKAIRIVTHNARFHSDEVFACATLLLVYPNAEITRSRNLKIISEADIVVDVGGEYDPKNLRFDHHQEGGAGERKNTIPYASFGLVWKYFSKELTTSADVSNAIEKRLVTAIDASDNGIDLYKAENEDVQPYMVQSAISAFNPTFAEGESDIDDNFYTVVDFAKKILMREIKKTEDLFVGIKHIKEAYEATDDKKILILDKNYPWDEEVSKMSEVLYVIRPNVQDSSWKVEAARDSIFSYELRKPLPAEWAGKRNGDFAEASGVSDAMFCHNKRFLAVAKSKEGAIELAKIAINS